MVAVCTVRRGHALETVTLHHPGKAFALGVSRNVNQDSRVKNIRAQFLTELVGAGVVGANFREVTARLNPSLGEVTRHRLGDLALVHLAEAQLDSVVAVGFVSTNLGDNVLFDLDHRHGNQLAVFIPDLGHAELAPQ